ncbi:VWA domain-containing protein [Gulosibacter molinativorax]|uniref:VWA domain-containing protein n=1 Tax=Gulosibacter molinativorax TaxID=256821 RepID=A0ABT7C610_9MICO|nr:VWA domain-containing protein [Gulosibacter molinativorax]MDJ1370614.1 VWA domain-containing protein [Gulosibacter molinativorax]QUY61972.1 von Willebrand factor type A [Gulosibacter molinativorax]
MIKAIHRWFKRTGARLSAVLALALTLPLALAGCGAFGSGEPLRILAGSEVRDLEPILEEMTRETGVQIELEYIGTLDGTEALLEAGSNGEWDATWFPSNRYLSLFPEGQDLIATSESIMRSPVVLGLKADVASSLGWSADAPPTWQEIIDAVNAGTLTYGMTSPISSNSGFTTLVQLATALSGTGTVLEPGDVAATTAPLQDFAKGQQLASGSSGWLLDKFIEDPTVVDGIFNYESVLQNVEVDGEPLTVLIPSDGVITSDYPLALLSGADEMKTEQFNLMTDYLLSTDVQQKIADDTHRRTSVTPPATDASVFELPFPNQLGTVQSLLQTWIADVKKPSHMVFAIDTSGSMSGDRMTQLDDALQVLSGIDNQGTGAFLKLQPREQITFLEFASSVKSDESFALPADQSGYEEAMASIGEHISTFEPGGGTSVYTTLAQAYESAVAGAGEDAISSIVLFTDGQSNEGMSYEEFESWYEGFVAENPEAKSIPVYTVQFGDANRSEMESIATLTGGRLFDATEDSLAAAFREIRGYL